MDDANSVTAESWMETSPSKEREFPPDGIVAYPAAFREHGSWFPALSFERHGKPFGDDFVLRAAPCVTADDAVAIAADFLDLADRPGSKR